MIKSNGYLDFPAGQSRHCEYEESPGVYLPCPEFQATAGNQVKCHVLKRVLERQGLSFPPVGILGTALIPPLTKMIRCCRGDMSL